MSESMKRYDLEYTGGAYSEHRSMVASKNGDWVDYDDAIVAIAAARREEREKAGHAVALARAALSHLSQGQAHRADMILAAYEDAVASDRKESPDVPAT